MGNFRTGGLFLSHSLKIQPCIRPLCASAAQLTRRRRLLIAYSVMHDLSQKREQNNGATRCKNSNEDTQKGACIFMRGRLIHLQVTLFVRLGPRQKKEQSSTWAHILNELSSDGPRNRRWRRKIMAILRLQTD